MPLLPDIDPKAAITAESKHFAKKMGTALILALFGERFGTQPVFEGIGEGLQNFNGFIVGENRQPLAFLSFLRFGQGEITCEEHQQKILSSMNQLVQAGFPTPRFLTGKNGELLLTIPDSVFIDGTEHPVPQGLRQSKWAWAVAQEYIKGTPVPHPVQTEKQAYHMGRLHGLYLATGKKIFTDIGTMRNPVSLPALQKMVQEGLGITKERPLKNAIARTTEALQQKIIHEERVLQNHAENAEKQRRLYSLNLVQELTDAIAHRNWAEHTLQDYETAISTWQRHDFDALPDARMHGDFHAGNMFAEGMMYDMGWMGDGKRLFDLCQPIVLSCHKNGRLWKEGACAFLKGVQEHIVFTAQEWEALPYMLDIVHLRSTATRFTSVITPPETQFVLKSPLELQERQKTYRTEMQMFQQNWAECRAT